MNKATEKSQNPIAPSRDMVAFAVAVPGVQEYDTITVDRDLLCRQIDWLLNTHCSEVHDAEDCKEGILNLLEGILDLGLPPSAEEEM